MEGVRVHREAALAVVPEQQQARAGHDQDEVLVAVVVDVREERLRGLVEHGRPALLGHVLERAVALVPEQPVGQASRLRDEEVV